MINKPTGYEEAKAAGQWTPLSTGGHYLQIKNAEVRNSKKGDPMLVIEYDTHETDHQPEYFKKIWNGNYWRGTHYLMLTSQEWAVRNLKSFITSVENSNEGFEFDWNDKNNTESLIGKNVGGIFGEVESEYKGDRRINVELRWFCSTEKVPTANKPEPVLLDKTEPEPEADTSNLPFDL